MNESILILTALLVLAYGSVSRVAENSIITAARLANRYGRAMAARSGSGDQ
jgi:hypothetical protein